jgi:hypothetical protein
MFSAWSFVCISHPSHARYMSLNSVYGLD